MDHIKYKRSNRPETVLRFLLFFVFSISVSGNLIAQYQDFRSWWNVDISKDISKDLKAGLEFSQRFKENSIQYDRTLATLGLEYELFKDFSVEGGIRYVIIKDNYLNLANKYRLHGNVSYAFTLDRLTLKLREQIQYGFDDLSSLNEYYYSKLTNRNKFSLKYDVFGSPVSLETSYEIFVDLNDNGGIMLANHRIHAGASMVLSSKSDIALAYMFDKEVNEKNPLTANVLILSFSYDL